ncbi:MAG: SRPBCC family protein [bacterium]
MAIRSERHEHGRRRAPLKNGGSRVAQGLGWFSIGLGLAELAAPEKVGRLIGIRDKTRRRALIRSYGAREVAVGVGLLSGTKPAAWLWGRLAGDAVDIASLGAAMRTKGASRTRLAATTAAVLPVMGLDAYCAVRSTRDSSRTRVEKTISVNRSPEDVYFFWKDPEKFSTFLDRLDSLRMTGGKRRHGEVKASTKNAWPSDAEIVQDEPGARIAWRSADAKHSGAVRFERAPGARGTVVRLELEYPRSSFARVLGAVSGLQLERALRLLKQILETGDIVRSDASIHAGMHPAQPPAEPQTDGEGVQRGAVATAPPLPVEFP